MERRVQQHEAAQFVPRETGGHRESREPLPPGIGWTGLLTAHMRAVESRRKDRLFDDALATATVGLVRGTVRTDPDAALPTGPEQDGGDLTEAWYMLATYLGVRTRYYDEHVLAAVATGIRQVVVVAAGFDSRAVRLGLPADTTVYEVDTEPVLRFKEAVMDSAGLTPNCVRRTVAADLRGPWARALTARGFDPLRPTMWIIEGLFMYLSSEDSDRLLDTVARLSARGSRLALEYFDSAPRQDDVTTVDATESAVIGRIVGFFQDGPALPPTPWLTAHGWEPDVTTLADEIASHGRNIPRMFQKGRPHKITLWLAHGRHS
ncbi:SAM-dependent methyltransferase [Streptomyces sp. NPDC059629]|uniref:SAM-dependent methyltransferase n=1 Tax=Streptomyces sp. NPDC059629 TaxID=3346889 RepID=UPI0036997B04